MRVVLDETKDRASHATFPGTHAIEHFDVLAFDAASGLPKLAYPNATEPASPWASVTGKGPTAVLTLGTVGGGSFGGGAACLAKTFNASVVTTPLCSSAKPGGAAVATSLIGTYTLAGLPSPSPSPSPSALASASPAPPSPPPAGLTGLACAGVHASSA